MPNITYIESNGTEHVIDVKVGKSVMEGARDNGVPGIIAECGGACACSTCHVKIDQKYHDRLPEQEDMEKEMLDFAIDPDPERSRLSCQIPVDESFDGLVVHIPEEQAV